MRSRDRAGAVPPGRTDDPSALVAGPMTPSPAPRDLVRVFGRIGLLSFGGPAAQIALMHRELVDRRPWLTERQFLNALSFCMLLPGPEAMQLATYAGWRLRGVPGGLIAGGLFVLPGAAVILALACAYAVWGDLPLAQALFLGVQAAVVVIVIEALVKVARRALTSRDAWVIAALSFLAIFVLSAPFPAIVLAAGIWGAVRGLGAADAPEAPRPGGSVAATLRTVALWSAIWLSPLALLWAAGARTLTEIGVFFSTLAVVTFGGAYAVLAWMADVAVTDRGWLTAPQMMDALGLAETTPGPLILVTEFVGFLAGWGAGGPALAFAAAAVTLWMTFAPCFLWIFAGAPWIETIAARPRLRGALAGITAAVVGVILNLSLWFAAHVFFGEVGRWTAGPVDMVRPDPASLDPRAAALAAVAALLLFGARWSLPAVLAVAAILGAALSLV